MWLARDLAHNSYVALKVQKSARNYLEAAYDEVEILDVIAKNTENAEWIKSLIYYNRDNPDKLKQGAISEHCHNVMLLNSFQYAGPNGNHFVMVFEILGVNLLEIMKRFDYKGIPIPLVRRIAKQVLMGLDYLHRICKVIHTDLKPENVIVALTPSELDEIIKRGSLSGKPASKAATLLQDVDTTGMTKQQKKKLKKKIKKTNKQADGCSDESFMETERQTRYQQIDVERPRSYSLPNKVLSAEAGEYEYAVDRDFRSEI